MTGCLLIVAVCAALGQSEAVSQTEPETCTVILKDGRKFHVIWDGEPGRGAASRLERDTPWEPGTVSIRHSEIAEKGVRPETRRARQRRLREGWIEAGYTEINGRYYKDGEVERADEALRMAGVTKDSEPPPEPDNAPAVESPAPPPTEPVPEAAPPGFLRQWGLHAALLAGALVLVGVVAKTMLMAGP